MDVESGAPALFPSVHQPADIRAAPPEAFYQDIAARAGLTVSNPSTPADQRALGELLGSTLASLEPLVTKGRLKPGKYSYRNRLRGALAPFAPPEPKGLAEREVVEFEVTAEHLTLLANAWWDGPGMNPKRPYGGASYFEADMARILGLPTTTGPDGALADHAEELRLTRLHHEMVCVLQIFLENADPPA